MSKSFSGDKKSSETMEEEYKEYIESLRVFLASDAESFDRNLHIMKAKHAALDWSNASAKARGYSNFYVSVMRYVITHGRMDEARVLLKKISAELDVRLTDKLSKIKGADDFYLWHFVRPRLRRDSLRQIRVNYHKQTGNQEVKPYVVCPYVPPVWGGRWTG